MMRDGHLNKCKECTKNDASEHRHNNIEKIREYDRNRPNAKERAKNNKIKRHENMNKNPEAYKIKKREALRKYREKNKEKYHAHCILYKAVVTGKIKNP